MSQITSLQRLKDVPKTCQKHPQNLRNAHIRESCRKTYEMYVMDKEHVKKTLGYVDEVFADLV